MNASIETLDVQARRAAIDGHRNLLGEQPDGDIEAIEFTHYECWFLPPDEDYTLEYLREAMLNAPSAVAAQCEQTFSSWMKTLEIAPPAEGWFADLYMRGYNEHILRTGVASEDAGWAGIAEMETDAVLRALDAGYRVYEGSAFWEVYPDFEEEPSVDEVRRFCQDRRSVLAGANLDDPYVRHEYDCLGAVLKLLRRAESV
ncbi:MAG: hypothetical protein FGM40_05875 [Rhodocyclaceae bacterium]|nr:hypothetical protein [Rhodocyclaceae bacterium]